MNKRSFFAALFFGIALLFGALAVWQRERQMWLPVEARVDQVWDRTIQHPPLDTRYGSLPPRKDRIPMVDYSYQVDGRTYSGRTAIGGSGGGSFRVYYDPDHPERSRGDRPNTFALALVLALGAAFFVAGLSVWLGGPSGAEHSRAKPA